MGKRTFNDISCWSYGEKQLIDNNTGKCYTLTQPKDIFREDYYHVRRGLAIENVPADVVPEKEFYVYEFSYMVSGTSLCVRNVTEDIAIDLIGKNLPEFLQGKAGKCIEEYFLRYI